MSYVAETCAFILIPIYTFSGFYLRRIGPTFTWTSNFLLVLAAAEAVVWAVYHDYNWALRLNLLMPTVGGALLLLAFKQRQATR